VKSLARANEMIRRLTALGCRFALDDFGTGSNSLTYLNALPIAGVKIDGSILESLAHDESDRLHRLFLEI
jgi:EAL domain-containing protein (putative c-di-GMP-specific phosphodiesterase class I)